MGSGLWAQRRPLTEEPSARTAQPPPKIREVTGAGALSSVEGPTSPAPGTFLFLFLLRPPCPGGFLLGGCPAAAFRGLLHAQRTLQSSSFLPPPRFMSCPPSLAEQLLQRHRERGQLPHAASPGPPGPQRLLHALLLLAFGHRGLLPVPRGKAFPCGSHTRSTARLRGSTGPEATQLVPAEGPVCYGLTPGPRRSEPPRIRDCP